MSGQPQISTPSGASTPAHISIAEPTESRPHSPFNLYHLTVDEEKKVMKCQKQNRLRRFVQKHVDRIRAKLSDLGESLGERKGETWCQYLLYTLVPRLSCVVHSSVLPIAIPLKLSKSFPKQVPYPVLEFLKPHISMFPAGLLKIIETCILCTFFCMS